MSSSHCAVHPVALAVCGLHFVSTAVPVVVDPRVLERHTEKEQEAYSGDSHLVPELPSNSRTPTQVEASKAPRGSRRSRLLPGFPADIFPSGLSLHPPTPAGGWEGYPLLERRRDIRGNTPSIQVWELLGGGVRGEAALALSTPPAPHPLCRLPGA